MADKKQIVRDINSAFENANIDGFLDHCAEDIQWTMPGEKSTSGKQAIRDWMGSMGECPPPKINVTSIAEDGDSVVCWGDMSMKGKDGSDEAYEYCDIYTFAGDKIAALKSFVVKQGEKSDPIAQGV